MSGVERFCAAKEKCFGKCTIIDFYDARNYFVTATAGTFQAWHR
jgi:hypothetical protein